MLVIKNKNNPLRLLKETKVVYTQHYKKHHSVTKSDDIPGL